MGVGRRRSRWRAASIAAVIVVVALGAGLAAFAFVFVPFVLPNLQTSVAETDRTESVRDAGTAVTVVVPAGWSVQRESEDAPRVVVRTPDAKLSITVDVADADLATAASTAGIEGLGPLHRETVTTGAPLVHAQAAEALVAAIGGERASGRFVVRVTEDVSLEEYRAEIAGLLDTVRVES
ncbi:MULTISPECIES: hypothetical protein [Microbacterium]|uniref:hypothetical protein n=1 Tax=Microbacterium TaxID=33882 RepID=UPI0023DA787B|nr:MULTISPECIES: hypothetical protein [Microbacterium]MDF2045308.1 hypothetical protein [Microbacterium sp. Kw_RZR3]MDQ1074136.1 hypothetical protein [Microbacterium sp. SORGH_AS_0969]MDQ1114362.1 hypothetical protein [Microbacterium testaceum]